MKIIFISGSRGIQNLDDLIKFEILTFIDENYKIILGDADGVDKLVQTFLVENGYLNVKIYAIGGNARNNVGNWNIESIINGLNVNKYNFYQEKDKKMTKDCDLSMVIWDGKSKGSLNNIKEILAQNKELNLYFNGNFYKKIKNYEEIKLIKKNSNVGFNNQSYLF